tara:strand:- start:117 stop:965 length:849 start_codon:yes stop_codon:yes gene_type:complete
VNLAVNPLSDALGAEIIGVDLSRPLDQETFSKLHQAHLDYQVVVFRDQALTPQQQIDFSKRFGPLDHHPADDATLPGYPDILVISTKRENGEYIGIPDAGPMWHSDLAYMEKPSLGSLLYAVELPTRGGNTSFASMYLAYETLPNSIKTAIEDKRALNLAGRNNANRNYDTSLTEEQQQKVPAVTHPLVRTHPETGRKSIFANPQHTLAIEGLPQEESNAILEEIFAHSTQPDFVYEHRWQSGDLGFWDNRCVLHIADLSQLDDPSYIRHMHRTTIKGDVPI